MLAVHVSKARAHTQRVLCMTRGAPKPTSSMPSMVPRTPRCTLMQPTCIKHAPNVHLTHAHTHGDPSVC